VKPLLFFRLANKTILDLGWNPAQPSFGALSPFPDKAEPPLLALRSDLGLREADVKVSGPSPMIVGCLSRFHLRRHATSAKWFAPRNPIVRYSPTRFPALLM
jgi:hypothetical protein